MQTTFPLECKAEESFQQNPPQASTSDLVPTYNECFVKPLLVRFERAIMRLMNI